MEPVPASTRSGTYDPDYKTNWTHRRVFGGPIVRGAIYRRNTHRIGGLYMGGYVDGGVVENNEAVSFDLNGSQGTRTPVNVFARGNEQR